MKMKWEGYKISCRYVLLRPYLEIVNEALGPAVLSSMISETCRRGDRNSTDYRGCPAPLSAPLNSGGESLEEIWLDHEVRCAPAIISPFRSPTPWLLSKFPLGSCPPNSLGKHSKVPTLLQILCAAYGYLCVGLSRVGVLGVLHKDPCTGRGYLGR